jgi:hypothetical protein
MIVTPYDENRKWTPPPFHVREAQSDIFVLYQLNPEAYELCARMVRALISHAHAMEAEG